MRLLGLLLLLALICQLATSTPIFNGGDDTGFQSRFRSARFGDTIRDWYRTLKDRLVKRWQEWFGTGSSTPNLSAQDILNIDKTLEKRLPGYPGFFLDLSNVSFDPKQDWGIRVGNWYVVRKVAGDVFNSDSDSDEWNIIPIMPKLPPTSITGINWTPDTYGFGIPQTMHPVSTTPKSEVTTSRQESSQTDALPTSTKAIVTSVEPLRPTTDLTTSMRSTITSTEQTAVQSIGTFTESVIISTDRTTPPTDLTTLSIKPIVTSTETTTQFIEPAAILTDPTVISTEQTAVQSIGTSTESVMISTARTTLSIEPIMSTDLTTSSTKSVVTSTETTTQFIEPAAIFTDPSITSTMISTEKSESNMISAESSISSTESSIASTESVTISTESTITSTKLLPLPVLNKRIEDNETTNKRTKKPPPNRTNSAEVIMF